MPRVADCAGEAVAAGAVIPRAAGTAPWDGSCRHHGWCFLEELVGWARDPYPGLVLRPVSVRLFSDRWAGGVGGCRHDGAGLEGHQQRRWPRNHPSEGARERKGHRL